MHLDRQLDNNSKTQQLDNLMLLPFNKPEDLPGLRPEYLSGLKILKCYIVKAPYVLEIIKTEFKNNQAKRERYNSSLGIVDWFTTSDACKQQFCS